MQPSTEVACLDGDLIFVILIPVQENRVESSGL
jgi:hypothetical protein